MFELQLFARILDIDITKPEERKRIPRLVFPDPNEDADTDKIDNILKLYNPGVGLAPIVTIEEARRMVQEVVDIPEVDLSTLDKPKTREERPPPAPTPVPNTTTPEPRTVASETMTTNMKGHKHRVVIDSKGSGIAE